MIETYCDACGARIEGVHESDVMVYFRYTPEAYVDRAKVYDKILGR